MPLHTPRKKVKRTLAERREAASRKRNKQEPHKPRLTGVQKDLDSGIHSRKVVRQGARFDRKRARTLRARKSTAATPARARRKR